MLRAYHSWTKSPADYLVGSCRFRYQVKVNTQATKYGNPEVSHTVTTGNTWNTRYPTNTFTVKLQRLCTAHLWHLCFHLTSHPLNSTSVSRCILLGSSVCLAYASCHWNQDRYNVMETKQRLFIRKLQSDIVYIL